MLFVSLVFLTSVLGSVLPAYYTCIYNFSVSTFILFESLLSSYRFSFFQRVNIKLLSSTIILFRSLVEVALKTKETEGDLDPGEKILNTENKCKYT